MQSFDSEWQGAFLSKVPVFLPETTGCSVDAQRGKRFTALVAGQSFGQLGRSCPWKWCN